MRSRARVTTSLAVGSAGNGLLAYLVFAVTTHALGAQAAAPVSVLWSYWAFAGAAFTFPLQHWIARSVTAYGEGSVRRALPGLALVLLAMSLLAGALAWVVREPLFRRGDAWFPALVAAVTLGAAVTGLLRGGLSGRDRFVAVAWSLAVENAVRCAAALALLVAGDHRVVHYGMCLVAGHLVVVLWPSAVRFRDDAGSTAAPSPLAFLAGASLAQLVGQCVLVGAPVVLALVGGPQRQVTTLFAALALFRAPYTVALGMVSQVTSHVARLAVGGRVDALRRARRRARVGAAAAVVLAAGCGTWLGPWALRLVFGPDVVMAAGLTGLVAVGCTVAVANLLLMVSALAQGRSTAVARAWLLGVALAAVAFAALARVPAQAAVVCCFLTAEVVSLGALSLVEARRAPVPRRSR